MPRGFASEEIERLEKIRHAHCNNPRICKIVERNIDTLLEVRRQTERTRGSQDRIADWITSFSGSMPFIYLHAAWFALWIAVNLAARWAFDPFPFGLLTLIVSLEAIFLSTFVLLSQNRQAEMADRRADLDLQINLLTEHEVTRVLTLVDAIADHLGLQEGEDPEVDELKKDVAPEQVLRELSLRSGESAPRDDDRAGDVRPPNEVQWAG